MLFHSEKIENVLKTLETDAVKGLESKSAEKLREKYGENTLTQRKPKSMLRRYDSYSLSGGGSILCYRLC